MNLKVNYYINFNKSLARISIWNKTQLSLHKNSIFLTEMKSIQNATKLNAGGN